MLQFVLTFHWFLPAYQNGINLSHVSADSFVLVLLFVGPDKIKGEKERNLPFFSLLLLPDSSKRSQLGPPGGGLGYCVSK